MAIPISKKELFMKNILLCCSAGMSTSMLVNKMKEASKALNVESKIWAVAKNDLQAHKDEADIILLGPQIRFALNEIKQEVNDTIPIKVIDVMDYGTMNGKKVLEDALAEIQGK